MSKYAKTFFKNTVLIIAVIMLLFSVIFPAGIAIAAESTGTNIADSECTDNWFTCQILKVFGPTTIVEVFFKILNFSVDLVLGNLVSLAGKLFEWTLGLVTSSDMSIVKTGWSISLGFANNFFVLILLAIAISTILGLSQYNYKKMLPKFFVVILLINFSMVIGLMIINIAQVPANFFYKGISANPSGAAASADQVSMNIMQRMNSTEAQKQEQDQGTGIMKYFETSKKDGKNPINDNFVSLLAIFVYKIFTYLLLILVFIAGAVYMINRTFMLWLLLMLAPLAWIASLLPSLEKHWKTWWDKFIKWTIFAPAYLFFLYLGMKIYEASPPNLGLSSFKDLINPAKLIQTAIVGFIMLAGLQIASNLGVGGSNFVLNYANKSKDALGKKFKSFMPTQTYGQMAGEWAAKKAGGLMTLGGRVSVPGVIDRTKYEGDRARQEAARLEEQKKKESLQNVRQELKDFRKRGSRKEREQKLDQLEHGKMATKQKLIELQLKETLTAEEEANKKFFEDSIESYNKSIKNMLEKNRMDELNLLKKFRKATGSEKVDPAKELKELLKKMGGGEEEKPPTKSK